MLIMTNEQVGMEVWAVLLFSFMIDGRVLFLTLQTIMEDKPKGVSIFEQIKKVSMQSSYLFVIIHTIL